MMNSTKKHRVEDKETYDLNNAAKCLRSCSVQSKYCSRLTSHVTCVNDVKSGIRGYPRISRTTLSLIHLLLRVVEYETISTRYEKGKQMTNLVRNLPLKAEFICKEKLRHSNYRVR